MRGWRSKSLSPSSASRPRICWATAPCVTPSSSAASRKFRCRVTTSKTRRPLSEGRRLDALCHPIDFLLDAEHGTGSRRRPDVISRAEDQSKAADAVILPDMEARMSVEKVAIVTAGGSGMGAAAAKRLAEDGFQVAILSSSGKGEALASGLGGFGVTGLQPVERRPEAPRRRHDGALGPHRCARQQRRPRPARARSSRSPTRTGIAAWTSI